MNRRRRWVWLWYFTGVAVIVLVLLGISGQVLSLERAEVRGRAVTAQQEASRLALWRMDSWLAPVLAREARRPYFEYRPVLPVGRAYENMWDPILPGDRLLASPLISAEHHDDRVTGPNGDRLIRLHLQIEPDGTVRSPESPTDAQLVKLVLADPLIAMGTAERDRAGAILSVLTPMLAQNESLVQRGSSQSRDRSFVVGEFGQVSSAGMPVPGVAVASQPVDGRPEVDSEGGRRASGAMDSYPGRFDSKMAGRGEYEARRELANLVQQTEAPQQQFYKNNVIALADQAGEPVESKDSFAFADKQRVAGEVVEGALDRSDVTGEQAKAVPSSVIMSGESSFSGGVASTRGNKESPASGSGFSSKSEGDLAENVFERVSRVVPSINVGAMQPRWLRSSSGEPELIYLRSVEIGGEVYQQGFWLDWPALQRALLAQSDGLPADAQLDPVTPGPQAAGFNPQLQLATVPAVLRLPALGSQSLGMTPARWSLMLTWFAVIASVGTIGVVLRTAMRLSDRRVRFVGAVTHELRTPLTTFRLYSQMLADGMVTEEDSKKEYLNTLKQESARLAGIVENVLAYARLNRAGPDQSKVRTEVMTPEALLVRLRPGLSRRAEQSGMDLIVSNEAGESGSHELLVDPQSVERILTNLVDNACKYAAPTSEDDSAAETRIHLDLRVAGENLEILVADYGPGIDPADRGKVFGEFQRGRAGQRADRSGLGLGLALSRGLARESGGELKLVRRRGHGAEFLLTLPMQPHHRHG